MSLGVLGQECARGIEMGVLADAGENVERLPAVRPGVLDPIRRHEEQAKMFREITELPVDPIFAAQEMALDLDADILATEVIDKKLRAFSGIPGSARALACRIRRLAEWPCQAERVSGEGAGNSTRSACAPQQCDEAVRVLR